MSRQIGRSLDGISFDEFRARYTGTVLLEDQEASASALDEITVEVIVSKVKDVAGKVDKGGNVIRIAVREVQEARLLEGELRALLVERLNLLSAEEDEPVLITPGERTPAQRAPADEETGEIVELPDGYPVVDFEGIVGHIKDHVPASATGMPNVKPFDLNSFDAPTKTAPSKTPPTGSRDPALTRFLGEL